MPVLKSYGCYEFQGDAGGWFCGSAKTRILEKLYFLYGQIIRALPSQFTVHLNKCKTTFYCRFSVRKPMVTVQSSSINSET